MELDGIDVGEWAKHGPYVVDCLPLMMFVPLVPLPVDAFAEGKDLGGDQDVVKLMGERSQEDKMNLDRAFDTNYRDTYRLGSDTYWGILRRSDWKNQQILTDP